MAVIDMRGWPKSRVQLVNNNAACCMVVIMYNIINFLSHMIINNVGNLNYHELMVSDDYVCGCGRAGSGWLIRLLITVAIYVFVLLKLNVCNYINCIKMADFYM